MRPWVRVRASCRLRPTPPRELSARRVRQPLPRPYSRDQRCDQLGNASLVVRKAATAAGPTTRSSCVSGCDNVGETAEDHRASLGGLLLARRWRPSMRTRRRRGVRRRQRLAARAVAKVETLPAAADRGARGGGGVAGTASSTWPGTAPPCRPTSSSPAGFGIPSMKCMDPISMSEWLAGEQGGALDRASATRRFSAARARNRSSSSRFRSARRRSMRLEASSTEPR